ncbi:methyl-accepting chemotaxis protein [Paenibacillus sp. SYP-B3998]|uniref:Methyl-accepting chemotaxis protein n=1 Tax=Paenibacillus sp. SYP-B3998 TaxID=2678564 RepID=A0A6G3ZZR8_9BACL|nr:methyl-accepting chemotaxis protein [Paenibacillus sp. SYP-B3998]NEW07632.1 methyl-accepting chemotaxis protein [Paenibacillus sp. SYP-B3998]
MKISTWLKVMIGVFTMLFVGVFICVYFFNQSLDKENQASKRQIEFKQLGVDLANASDYLTNEARAYVQFGDKTHYDNYWKEVNDTKTRDYVVEKLKELGSPQSELDYIAKAKANSDALVKTEDAAMKAIAAGDFTKARTLMFDKNYDANKKVIMDPITDFQNAMNKRAQEESEQARLHAQQMLYLTIGLLIATFGILLFIFLFFLHKLKPLRVVQIKLSELAASGGDLTARLPVTSSDEIGTISSSLNSFLHTLQAIVHEIISSSHGVADSSTRLIRISEQVSSSTHHTSEAMQEVQANSSLTVHSTEESSRVIEEMSKGIQQIAASASDLSNLAKDSEKESRLGFELMQEAMSQMEHIQSSVIESSEIVSALESRTGYIEQIVAAITSVSSQTNLLALNASIEAARAGEHGRGFSVVATEIRRLAEQSRLSAEKISVLLKEIQTDTNHTAAAMKKISNEVTVGGSKVNHASRAFQQILLASQGVSLQLQEVSAASEEMAAGSEEVSASVIEITQVSRNVLGKIVLVKNNTERQTKLADEASEISQKVNFEASKLQELVCKFKV